VEQEEIGIMKIIKKFLPWLLLFIFFLLIFAVSLILIETKRMDKIDNDLNRKININNNTSSDNKPVGFKKNTLFLNWEPGMSDNLKVSFNVLINRQGNRLIISCYSDNKPDFVKTWQFNQMYYPMAVYNGKKIEPVKLLLFDDNEYRIPYSSVENKLKKESHDEIYKNLSFMAGHLVVAVTTDDEDYGFLFPSGEFYCE